MKKKLYMLFISAVMLFSFTTQISPASASLDFEDQVFDDGNNGGEILEWESFEEEVSGEAFCTTAGCANVAPSISSHKWEVESGSVSAQLGGSYGAKSAKPTGSTKLSIKQELDDNTYEIHKLKNRNVAISASFKGNSDDTIRVSLYYKYITGYFFGIPLYSWSSISTGWVNPKTTSAEPWETVRAEGLVSYTTKDMYVRIEVDDLIGPKYVSSNFDAVLISLTKTEPVQDKIYAKYGFSNEIAKISHEDGQSNGLWTAETMSGFHVKTDSSTKRIYKLWFTVTPEYLTSSSISKVAFGTANNAGYTGALVGSSDPLLDTIRSSGVMAKAATQVIGIGLAPFTGGASVVVASILDATAGFILDGILGEGTGGGELVLEFSGYRYTMSTYDGGTAFLANSPKEISGFLKNVVTYYGQSSSSIGRLRISIVTEWGHPTYTWSSGAGFEWRLASDQIIETTSSVYINLT